MSLKVIEPKKLYATILLSGYTISTFAQKIGVSKGAISLYVNGKRNIRPDIAKRISVELGKGMEELFKVE